MFERRDRLYAELGVPPEEPEDPLDRWRRERAEREEPEPRERVVPPTLAEIDQRIADRRRGRVHDRPHGRKQRGAAERMASGRDGTTGAGRPTGRARTVRQAADGQAVEAGDGLLRGRRRRV